MFFFIPHKCKFFHWVFTVYTRKTGRRSTSYCLHPNSLLWGKDPTQKVKNLYLAKLSIYLLPNKEYQSNKEIKLKKPHNQPTNQLKNQKRKAEEMKKCLEVKLHYLRNNIILHSICSRQKETHPGSPGKLLSMSPFRMCLEQTYWCSCL